MDFNSYSLAGDDPNPMSHAEVDELKRLVNKEMLPFVNPNIVNIGAERGTSTLAILEERPNATIFSIDVDPCDSEFGNARKAGLDAHRIIRCLGRSQDIGRWWPYYVDFIWVDGNHSYEGVAEDIDIWLPKLIPLGTIAFHDYFEGEPPPHNPSGAGRAVREKMMIENYELISEVERIRAFRI